jgi:adenylylsulfate kinase-like enzyme
VTCSLGGCERHEPKGFYKKVKADKTLGIYRHIHSYEYSSTTVIETNKQTVGDFSCEDPVLLYTFL